MQPYLTWLSILGLLAGCGGGPSSDVERILDEVSETHWHQAAEIADMDGDGLADIVTVSHVWETDDAHLNLFQQLPGGGFAAKAQIGLGRGADRRVEDVLVADFNLDGLPDVAVAHLGMTADGSAYGTEVTVLIKQGMGLQDFLPYRSYPVADNPYRLAVGDLDLDGLPDLAVAADGGAFMLLQNGAAPGQFMSARSIDGGRARDLAVGDVDRDGLPDVLVVGGFGIHLHGNQAANPGIFSLTGAWSTPTWPSAMAMADINGDGWLDVATALSESDSFDWAGIVYRLQDPLNPGAFGAEVEHRYGQARTPGSLTATDMDGDGRADLVAAVRDGAAGVSIAVQTTNGAALGLPDFYSSGQTSGPWSAAIGQLGPDAIHDVVLAHALNGVHVHRGASPGTFDAAVKIGE
jgi:hypothetical protein